jgi:hypothetical protein
LKHYLCPSFFYCKSFSHLLEALLKWFINTSAIHGLLKLLLGSQCYLGIFGVVHVCYPNVFNVVWVFSALFGHFYYYSCLLLTVISVVQLLPNVVQVLQMFIKCCSCYAWCFSQLPPLIPLFLFVVFSPFYGWYYPLPCCAIWRFVRSWSFLVLIDISSFFINIFI